MVPSRLPLDQILLSVVRWSLFALLFTPLMYWGLLYHPFDFAKSYFIIGVSEITLLFYVWLVYRQPKWRIRLSPPMMAFFILLAALFLASFIGVDASFSFWGSIDRTTGIMMWLHVSVIFVIAFSIFRTQEDWQKYFFVSTIVALVVAAVQMTYLMGLSPFGETKGGGLLGNSTFLGTYLLLQFFFALYLFFSSTKKSLRFHGLLASLILALVLFSTDAHAAIFSLLGGIVLFAALFLIAQGKNRFQKQCGTGLLAVLVVMFVLLTMLVFQPSSALHEKFIALASASRFVLWDIAWQAIQEKPMFGWGLENFQYISLDFYNPCLGSRLCGVNLWNDRAHNKILDVLVESGMLGLTAYLATFGVVIHALWKGFRERRLSWVAPVVFTSALAAYFVQNLTAFDTATSYLFWVVLLAACVALGAPEHAPDPSIAQKKWMLPAAVMTSVFVPIAFFFFFVQPMIGNLALRQSLAASTMEEHLAAYKRATTVSRVGLSERRVFLARQTAGAMWKTSRESMQAIDASARAELALAQTGLRETISTTPNDLLAYLNLALMYHTEARFFDSGKFQDAEVVLRKAIELNPRNPQPLWELAAVYLEQNRVDEALVMTQAALDLNSDVLESHVQRLIVVKFTGDEALFVQYAKEALALSPGLEGQIQLIYNADLEVKRTQLIFELY